MRKLLIICLLLAGCSQPQPPVNCVLTIEDHEEAQVCSSCDDSDLSEEDAWLLEEMTDV